MSPRPSKIFCKKLICVQELAIPSTNCTSEKAASAAPLSPLELTLHKQVIKLTDERVLVHTRIGTQVFCALHQHLVGVAAEHGDDLGNEFVPAPYDDTHDVGTRSSPQASLGIYNTTTFLTQPLLDRGTLDIALTGWHSEPMPISVVYPRNRQLNMKVRVFVTWVVELFANQPLLKKPGGGGWRRSIRVVKMNRPHPQILEPR